MKSRVEDLAIFGARPSFSNALHVGRPNIGERQRLLERINNLLDRRWLTNDGPFLREFEQPNFRNRGCQALRGRM